jgi:NADH dehydrogenase [ubiquinone] 1 alpha subcomplex assembly factor 7
MHGDPGNAIRAAIRAHGAIGFDRFMELALYGPGGFYTDPPVGTSEGRAFATSPHVHPVFGQLLAAGLLELWDGLGRPEPFRLTEVGAGDGTLARQLVQALSDVPLTYTAVERSPAARVALGEISNVVVEEQLPGGSHVVLAHELLDNLPFRRLRLTEAGPREIRVGLDGERFVEVLTAELDEEMEITAAKLDDVGEETVLPVGSFDFIDAVAAGFSSGKGYALMIDYGAEGHTGGPVHGYAEHRLVEDVLVDPGASDITSGVDFTRLAARAWERGLTAKGSVTQRRALAALGFERWTREELERQAALLDEHHGVEAVRTWSGRQAASFLVDPAGLGRTRWMLLASTGLPMPIWAGTG